MSRKRTVKENPGAKRETAKMEDLMYIGPTIPNVRYSTVFKNGVLPEAAERCIAEYPAMRKLFVPLESLAATTVLLRKESALTAIYKQTAQKFTRRK